MVWSSFPVPGRSSGEEGVVGLVGGGSSQVS